MRSKVRPSIDSVSSPESTRLTGGPNDSHSNGLDSDNQSPTAGPAPLDRESLRALGDELGQHFPQLTDETELVLMEISPHQLHAYWHITPWDLQSISHQPGAKHSRLILRFHDLSEADPTLPPPPSFDVEIDKPSGSQYVEVWEDARRFGAELGLLTPDGVLLDLARSNTVELPRASHSVSPGTQVLTLTPLADELYRVPSANEQQSALPSAEARPVSPEGEDLPTDPTLSGPDSKLTGAFPDTRLSPGDEPLSDVNRLPEIQDWGPADRVGVVAVESDTPTTQDAAGPAPEGELPPDHSGATDAAGRVRLNPRYSGALPSYPHPLSSHSHQPQPPAKPPADNREK